jgi:outer membrane protein OmpA-like peptidoglycan-associated protein
VNLRLLAQSVALTGVLLAAPCIAATQDEAAAPAPAAAPADASAPAAPAGTTALSGVIVSRDGDHMVVRVNGTEMPMTLAPGAQVQQVVGVAGLRREDHPTSDLLKGLAVTVDTYQSAGQTYASKVTFNGNDLKTAKAISAGTEEAKQKIIAEQAENKRRLSEAETRQADAERRLALVGQFSQKASTRVYFATGSAKIDAEGQQALRSIANQASTINGALLRVVGFTDSSGSVSANTKLSNQRASAVTAYLLKNLKVPPEKIATAGGLGSYVPVDNEDAGGNSAKNRRVTVFVLVSKASETDLKPASASTTTPRTAP